MIPPSLLTWIMFLGLTHIMLVAPGAWLLVLFCTVLLLSNTLCLTIRQDKTFKSARYAAREELSKLPPDQKQKLLYAIKQINQISKEKIKVYLLKGDEPNACANPIKENNKIVFGITTAGASKWTTEELIAVMAHEMAHIKYEHASKTVWTQLSLEFILYFIILVMSFSLSHMLQLLQLPSEYGWFGIAPVVFVLAPRGLNIFKTKVMSMEHEADLYSAENYSPAHIKSALTKITDSNESNSHPELIARINVIDSKNPLN